MPLSKSQKLWTDFKIPDYANGGVIILSKESFVQKKMTMTLGQESSPILFLDTNIRIEKDALFRSVSHFVSLLFVGQ